MTFSLAMDGLAALFKFLIFSKLFCSPFTLIPNRFGQKLAEFEDGQKNDTKYGHHPYTIRATKT